MAPTTRMAMVTGAGSGIGRAIALALAAKGSPVAAMDLDGASAEATASQIKKAGGQASAFQGDTSKSEELNRTVSGAIAALGPLEIMVNNAGILDGYFNVDETDEKTWRRVIDIDLTGVFLGCKRALAEMLPRARPYREHGLRGRTQRHRRGGGLRRREARRGRAHAPDGRDVLVARRDDQRGVPGAHPHGSSPALAGHPRARRARHERPGDRGQRRAGAGDCALRAPRHRGGHCLGGLLLGLRGGGLHHRPHHAGRRRLASEMITKFSVLYVGQIELDNVGLRGTPADERRYPNERLAEAFQTAKDVSQHMDEL